MNTKTLLPLDSCVEVPCEISSSGIKPIKAGKLPTRLAALMQTNINVQLLTAEAAMTNKKDTIYHAAMLDPLTSSILSIDEIASSKLESLLPKLAPKPKKTIIFYTQALY